MAKENLKYKAFLNSVTTIIDFSARLAVTFFVTPFILKGLGNSLYGTWKVLPQIIGYANLADLKSTESLKWIIAKERSKLDLDELRKYVTSTIVVLGLNLPILLLLSTFLVWYSPFIVGIEFEYHGLIRLTASLMFFDFLIQKFFAIVEAVLRGMNIGFKGIGVKSLVIIISGFFQYLVIILEYGLVALAAVQIFSTILTGYIIFNIVKRNVSWFGLGRYDKKKAIQILKHSGWYSVYGGIEMAIENSDKILLSYLLGPIFVTKYVITEFLIKSVQSIINNATLGIMPGMSLLVGEKRNESFIEYRNLVMQLTWLLIVSLGAVVIIFNESFISLWVGSDNFAGKTVNFLILIIVSQYLFVKNDAFFVVSVLETRKISLIGFGAVTLSIFFSYFLIIELQIIGLCIGIILGRIILSIYYPLVLKGILQTSNNINFFTIRMFLASVIIWSLAYYFNNYIYISEWVSLTIYMLIIFGAVFVFSFYCGLNQDYRKKIINSFLQLKTNTINSLKNKW